jgi:hypothetical protein
MRRRRRGPTIPIRVYKPTYLELLKEKKPGENLADTAERYIRSLFRVRY